MLFKYINARHIFITICISAKFFLCLLLRLVNFIVMRSMRNLNMNIMLYYNISNNEIFSR